MRLRRVGRVHEGFHDFCPRLAARIQPFCPILTHLAECCLQIRVVGMLSIAEDVEPGLARETIESVMVRGIFKASKEVKEALADRTC